MDNKKAVSWMFLALGISLVIYGFYSINIHSASSIAGQEDSTGMTILSIGAVVAIFSTGSMVDSRKD